MSDQITTYEVIDNKGNIILSGNKSKIDLSKLPEGIYTLKITSNDKISVQQFIKK